MFYGLSSATTREYLADDVRVNVKLYSYHVRDLSRSDQKLWTVHNHNILCCLWEAMVQSNVKTTTGSAEKGHGQSRNAKDVGLRALGTKTPTFFTVQRSQWVTSGQSWRRFDAARGRWAWIPIAIAIHNSAYLNVFCIKWNQRTWNRMDEAEDHVKRVQFRASRSCVSG